MAAIAIDRYLPRSSMPDKGFSERLEHMTALRNLSCTMPAVVERRHS